MSAKYPLKIKENYDLFFNPNRLLSYLYIGFYILIGGRGIGKTTGLLILFFKRWLSNGEQFVLVRRYKNEIKKAKGCFDKIVSGVTIKNVGDGVYEFRYQNKVMGWGIALTIQQSVKSGINFEYVKYILYDEAVLKASATSRYLADEIHFLFELISTITRERDDYKVFIVGNNADIFNPYFEYFSIPTFDNVYIDKERGIYCELCPTKEELLEQEKKSPLYRATKNTSYGEYHYNNKVLVDSDDIKIGVKDYRDKLLFRLVFNNQTLNVYLRRDNELSLFIEWRDKVIDDSMTYKIMENNNPNYMYMKLYRTNDIKSLVDRAYYTKAVTYQNEKAYQIFKHFMEELK